LTQIGVGSWGTAWGTAANNVQQGAANLLKKFSSHSVSRQV